MSPGRATSAPRRIIVIAKERPFDEEKWKELLMALAYELHDRRQAQAETEVHSDGAPSAGDGDEATP